MEFRLSCSDFRTPSTPRLPTRTLGPFQKFHLSTADFGNIESLIEPSATYGTIFDHTAMLKTSRRASPGQLYKAMDRPTLKSLQTRRYLPIRNKPTSNHTTVPDSAIHTLDRIRLPPKSHQHQSSFHLPRHPTAQWPPPHE